MKKNGNARALRDLGNVRSILEAGAGLAPDQQSFSPEVIEALLRRWSEFGEYNAGLSLEYEHKRWPRIAGYGEMILNELLDCPIARSEARELIDPLEQFTEKMRAFSKRLPPNRWKGRRWFMVALAFTTGRVLQRYNYPLSIEDNPKKERYGHFSAAFRVGLVAFGSKLYRTRYWLKQAKSALEKTPRVILSEAPNGFSRENVIISGPTKTRAALPEDPPRRGKTKKKAGANRSIKLDHPPTS